MIGMGARDDTKSFHRLQPLSGIPEMVSPCAFFFFFENWERPEEYRAFRNHSAEPSEINAYWCTKPNPMIRMER